MALILAYADITSTLVSDADGSPLNVQIDLRRSDDRLLHGGAALQRPRLDRMDWTVGGFYYDGDSVNNQIVSIPFLSAILDRRSVRRSPAPRSSTPTTCTSPRNESAFAHVVFDVTDKFAVTAGVRYSSDEKDVNFDNTRVQNPNVVVEGNNTDWKFGLDYQFTPDMSGVCERRDRATGREATTRVPSRRRR